ncbi:hypothetical protein ACUXCC_000544 [Cytobacillus horneckiae]
MIFSKAWQLYRVDKQIQGYSGQTLKHMIFSYHYSLITLEISLSKRFLPSL